MRVRLSWTSVSTHTPHVGQRGGGREGEAGVTRTNSALLLEESRDEVSEFRGETAGTRRQAQKRARDTLAKRAMSAKSPRPLDGLTVLVVDDHRDTLDMMQEYLAAAGATVLGAGSAKAALAFTETYLIDAVLVDLRMPGEDGWWLLRQLRTSPMPGAETIPVFATSGERHENPDLSPVFAGYFLKPINLDRLIAMLAPLPRRFR